MKKMSDVFELPVIAALMSDDHAGEITQSGESHFCLEDGRYWMASNIEHIEAAAHAINHVDALADALDRLLQTAWFESHLTTEEFYKLKSVVDAQAALAAYRGKA